MGEFESALRRSQDSVGGTDANILPAELLKGRTKSLFKPRGKERLLGRARYAEQPQVHQLHRHHNSKPMVAIVHGNTTVKYLFQFSVGRGHFLLR